MLTTTLSEIRVAGARGRPRSRPDRLLADKGYPSKRELYKGRNVVERYFNKLKQWRGIAMRSDKTARNYHAGLCLAATLHWLNTALSKRS